MEENANDYTVTALIKELGTSKTDSDELSKKSEVPPKKKPPHLSQRVETRQAQDKSHNSLTEEHKCPMKIYFILLNNIGNVAYKSFSANFPSNTERPYSMGCSYGQYCCDSMPCRPLFPRFTKDCNASSIAIGSSYAKSQQFSWAFFQHSVYCFIQLQPGTLVALVALTGC